MSFERIGDLNHLKSLLYQIDVKTVSRNLDSAEVPHSRNFQCEKNLLDNKCNRIVSKDFWTDFKFPGKFEIVMTDTRSNKSGQKPTLSS